MSKMRSIRPAKKMILNRPNRIVHESSKASMTMLPLVVPLNMHWYVARNTSLSHKSVVPCLPLLDLLGVIELLAVSSSPPSPMPSRLSGRFAFVGTIRISIRQPRRLGSLLLPDLLRHHLDLHVEGSKLRRHIVIMIIIVIFPALHVLCPLVVGYILVIVELVIVVVDRLPTAFLPKSWTTSVLFPVSFAVPHIAYGCTLRSTRLAACNSGSGRFAIARLSAAR